MSKRNPHENEGIGRGFNMAHNAWHGGGKWAFLVATVVVIGLAISLSASC